MSESNEPLKIVKLTVENFKRIEAVEITPEGDVVTLTGKNGAGKSSVLDSIEAAFGGAEAFPVMPIRKGQNKATVEVDLGELKVRRVIEEGKPAKFELVDGGGGTLKSPQAVMNSLYSKSATDPVEFARMKPKDQQAVVAKISGVDPDAFASKKQTLMTKRADVNRLAKQTRGAVDVKKAELDAAMKKAGLKDVPAETVSMADLLAEQRKGKEHNDRLKKILDDTTAAARLAEKHAKNGNELSAKIERMLAEIEQIRKEVASESQQAEMWKKTVERLDAEYKAETPFDPAPVEMKMAQAETINTCHRLNGELLATIKQADDTEKIADDYTAKLERLDEEYKTAVKAAKMPVEGLGFSDVGVTFNGIPFEEASAAEQLRISAAIAMSGDHRIRVCIVRDASLLDQDSVTLLAQVAKERGYQLWIEQVGQGESGILIVDGHVETKSNVQSATAE